MPTEKEKKFIDLVAMGHKFAEAATMAGYATKTYGYELKNKLANEIKEAVAKEINGASGMALQTLVKLAAGADSEAVQRQAAKDLLSMGGHDVQRTEDMTKPDDRTDEQLKQDLINKLASNPELAKALLESVKPDKTNITPLKAVNDTK